MKNLPWQLQLVRKSIKKKEKLKLLNKVLAFNASRKALDLGCAQGILSYFLRRKGGFWVSTDEDFPNLKTAQSLIQTNLVQMPAGVLPFTNQAFETAVCLDYLEHIDDDEECLAEIERVLKPGGELILITPQTGRFFILYKLRSWLGLKKEFFGHKRDGYRRGELESKLHQAGLKPFKQKSFSHFFSELIELLLNFFYIKILAPQSADKMRDGHIRPATSSEFDAQRKSFKVYSVIYPFVWLASKLDFFLFFLKGYNLMIWATKQR